MDEERTAVGRVRMQVGRGSRCYPIRIACIFRGFESRSSFWRHRPTAGCARHFTHTAAPARARPPSTRPHPHKRTSRSRPRPHPRPRPRLPRTVRRRHRAAAAATSTTTSSTSTPPPPSRCRRRRPSPLLHVPRAFSTCLRLQRQGAPPEPESAPGAGCVRGQVHAFFV